MKKSLTLALIALTLSACGAIQTGEVGVRTTFTGKVVPQEIDQGFYTHLTSKVHEFSTKEIAIELFNMQPKAGDNLTLDDLDIEVYYTIEPSSVVDMHIKYANRHERAGSGSYLPVYNLVKSFAREAVYETVSEYDSLVVHQERDKIRLQVKERTQEALDATDPGVFQIQKVVIRDVKTDPTIED